MTQVFDEGSTDWRDLVHGIVVVVHPRGQRKVTATFPKAPPLDRVDIEYEVVEVLHDGSGAGLSAGTRMVVAPANSATYLDAHRAYYEDGVGESWGERSFAAESKPEDGKPVVLFAVGTGGNHGLPPFEFAVHGSVEGPSLIPAIKALLGRK